MVKRLRFTDTDKPPAPDDAAGGLYFAAPKARGFIPSGCKLLDLVLGGGWAEGRIANIIGDKSTGKTLLCIEAVANFVKKYKERGRVFYREVEAAFDVDYAEALGMPVRNIDFSHNLDKPLETVEDLFEDMDAVLTKLENAKTKHPSLYIVDSLDALTDREEQARAMDKASYGADKSKKMSQLFRRLVRRFEQANMTVIIVSQVRSKIGVTFGERTTRSGGRALDFYGSQFIKLAHLSVLYQTRDGQRRAIGVSIKAKSTKNKIGLPFRECDFDLLFGYGIDDLDACLRWLEETKGLGPLGYHIVKTKKGDKRANGAFGSLSEVIDDIWSRPDEEFKSELKRVREVVEARWWQIERSHLPTRRKYE